MTGVRWRIEYAGSLPETYEFRDDAVYALRAARKRGLVATLVRVETTSRRWRVNGVLCLVWRCWWSKRWLWVAGKANNVVDDEGAAYAEAVEAAEKAARGQR